ncbi:MAG: energy transducer TonB [Elusimicrobia bacterium]|nr:energy transducer TonB [Elusimicrobiota bacterium]
MTSADDGMAPYLTYSLAIHVGAAALALALYSAAKISSTPVYMIDFVGPSAAILSPQAETAAAAKGPAPALQPQTETDEFSPQRHKGAPLPRPSLLRGWSEPTSDEKPAAPAPAATTAQPTAASAPASGAPAQAGIATDMPNFPYPWYISQIRQVLWEQWSSRMPKGAGECVVVFTLLPNGRFVDLRTEESSGDPAFDLAALSAVQDGAPYPPLPRGFKEPFLKIHLTLKSL